MTEHDETPVATSDETADLEETSNETAGPAETSGDAEPATGVTDLTAIRELVLRAHPDVVPELIGGESIEAIMASVGPAQDAYQRLAERFPQPAPPPPAPHVPAGGHRPAPIDPERLPTGVKIRRGLTNRRG